jgi:hypothetical protein
MLNRTEYKTDIPDIDGSFEECKTSINQPTGNFFYDPWKIKPEFEGTIWESLLESLPEVQGEARIIVMQPGTTYMAHSDIDNRWHLSLQGQQSYLIDLQNLEMHHLEQDGYWYYMDAGRMHVASNFGSIPRAQLVVRQLLVSCSDENLTKVIIKPSKYQHDYRYKFDSIVSPWLNRVNSNGKLKDFSFDGEVVTFKTTQHVLDSLNLTNDFIVIKPNS